MYEGKPRTKTENKKTVLLCEKEKYMLMEDRYPTVLLIKLIDDVTSYALKRKNQKKKINVN